MYNLKHRGGAKAQDKEAFCLPVWSLSMVLTLTLSQRRPLFFPSGVVGVPLHNLNWQSSLNIGIICRPSALFLDSVQQTASWNQRSPKPADGTGLLSSGDEWILGLDVELTYNPPCV